MDYRRFRTGLQACPTGRIEAIESEIMSMPNWDIQRKGRTWKSGEAHDRYQLSPEKIELIQGKLFWTERDRVMMLGLLLENVGVDKAVQLGDPEVWRAAVEDLHKLKGSIDLLEEGDQDKAE